MMRNWSENLLFEVRDSIVYPDGSEEQLVTPGLWVPNDVADEGEASIINVYLREQANPTKYLACLNAGSPVDTTTMATMSESKVPGVDGYNRQQVISTDWGAPALDAGDHMTTAAEKTFGPISGTTMVVTHVAMVTAATGTGGLFIGFVTLPATRNVAVGLSYKVTFRWKNQ